MRFTKGQSGNPNGRPIGSVNKRSQLAILLEPHAEALINKAVELALGGDFNALRLCIERLVPKAPRDKCDEVDADFLKLLARMSQDVSQKCREKCRKIVIPEVLRRKTFWF